MSANPKAQLAGIYLEKQQYDKSRAVVRKAKESRRWIAPEVLLQLKTAPIETESHADPRAAL